MRSRTRTLLATRHQPLPADGRGAPGVLPVYGELDFLTADQVRARIQDLAERHRQVTVDLAGATVYDQAALTALAQAHVRAHRAGCRLDFINGPAALAARTGAPGKARRARRPRARRTRALPTSTT